MVVNHDIIENVLFLEKSAVFIAGESLDEVIMRCVGYHRQ
jgi:hypothetical protein